MFVFNAMRIVLATEMTYRFNFIMNVLVMLLINLIFPLITFLIYLNDAGFPGWDFPQILLFQGFVVLLWGIQQVVFGNVSWELNRLIREGLFDRLMTYPYGALRYLLATNISLESIPQIFIGALMIVLGIFMANAQLSLMSIILFCFYAILGLTFLCSLIVIQMALIVRFVRVHRLGEIVRIVGLFGQYPASIYSRAVQAIVVGAIPFAMIAFFPSQAVLGRLVQIPWLSIIGVLAFLAIAFFSWQSALRRYGSAGG